MAQARWRRTCPCATSARNRLSSVGCGTAGRRRGRKCPSVQWRPIGSSSFGRRSCPRPMPPEPAPSAADRTARSPRRRTGGGLTASPPIRRALALQHRFNTMSSGLSRVPAISGPLIAAPSCPSPRTQWPPWAPGHPSKHRSAHRGRTPRARYKVTTKAAYERRFVRRGDLRFQISERARHGSASRATAPDAWTAHPRRTPGGQRTCSNSAIMSTPLGPRPAPVAPVVRCQIRLVGLSCARSLHTRATAQDGRTGSHTPRTASRSSDPANGRARRTARDAVRGPRCSSAATTGAILVYALTTVTSPIRP